MKKRKLVSFDWAMKNILRDKSNYIILEGFLFALLKKKIKIINLLESESNSHEQDLKNNRVDILAENEVGEHIIIEVQYADDKYFFKRLLFGTSKDVVNNIKSGDSYKKVIKVYSVSLIYFDVESHKSSSGFVDYVYHGCTEFKGLHNNSPVDIDNYFLDGYNKLERDSINIFPEYFIISMEVFDNRVNDLLDEWIYSFKNHDVRRSFKAPGIKEMSKKLDYESMTAEQKRSYNKYLEDQASNRAALESAEEKGEIKGKREGIYEQQVRSAKTMLSDGLSLDKISKFTGLSVEEIKKIEK